MNVIKAKGFEYFIPGKVSVSMKQGQAKPAKAIVGEGDLVVKGQLIGMPNGAYSVPVYASIDGVIAEIITRRISYKETAEIVVINGRKQQENSLPIDLTGNKESIDFLRDIGIVGMGGKGIPTFYKYKEKKEIHTIIINGIDYEPGLTHLYRLIMECPGKILFGAKELASISNAKKIIICIDNDSEEAKYILQKTISKYKKILNENIEIIIMPMKVKMALCDDRQLIQEVLGKADDGTIVSGAATAAAVYDGFYDAKPLVNRGITVNGCVDMPGNFWVPIGTSFKSLISYCGGLKADKCLVLDGGVMTGTSVDLEEAYVGITTTGITVIEKGDFKETSCIHCGACEKICPVHLVPYKIDRAYLSDKNQYKNLNIDDCIGCGSCSYVCPARRRLTERILIAGKELKKKRDYLPQIKKVLPESKGRYIELDDAWRGTLEDLETMTQSAPHIRRNLISSQIMLSVFMALLPAAGLVVYAEGVRALLLIFVSIIACMVIEGGWQLYRKQPVTIWDGSAAITGLLLAMTLPVSTPISLVLAGDIVAILPGKQIFGGLGQNRINPALAGSCSIKLCAGVAYLITQNSYLKDILFQSMIENAGLLLIFGFFLLVLQKIVFFWPPVILVALTALIDYGFGGGGLLNGNLILGGLFMASDYASTPASYKGRIFFCLASAGITLLLGQIFGIDFGVYFAILLMNITACILSRYTI